MVLFSFSLVCLPNLRRRVACTFQGVTSERVDEVKFEHGRPKTPRSLEVPKNGLIT